MSFHSLLLPSSLLSILSLLALLLFSICFYLRKGEREKCFISLSLLCFYLSTCGCLFTLIIIITKPNTLIIFKNYITMSFLGITENIKGFPPDTQTCEWDIIIILSLEGALKEGEKDGGRGEEREGRRGQRDRGWDIDQ